MNYDGGVQTGRTLPRSRYECHSCHLRNAVGTPKTLDTWAMRLHGVPLTDEQMDLLLVAAAEFRDLCDACRNCDHRDHLTVCRYRDDDEAPPCGCVRYEPSGWANAVAFVDWLRPDALGLVVNFTVSNMATEDRHRGVA
jgi:hypothetical protein